MNFNSNIYIFFSDYITLITLPECIKNNLKGHFDHKMIDMTVFYLGNKEIKEILIGYEKLVSVFNNLMLL